MARARWEVSLQGEVEGRCPAAGTEGTWWWSWGSAGLCRVARYEVQGVWGWQVGGVPQGRISPCGWGDACSPLGRIQSKKVGIFLLVEADPVNLWGTRKCHTGWCQGEAAACPRVSMGAPGGGQGERTAQLLLSKILSLGRLVGSVSQASDSWIGLREPSRDPEIYLG